MLIQEVTRLFEKSTEEKYMGWTVRVVPNKKVFDGIAFNGDDKIIVKGLATSDEIISSLKAKIREKKSSLAVSPDIQLDSVARSTGVFNQAFTNFFFSDDIPVLGKIIIDGAIYIDVLSSGDEDLQELYRADGFKQISDRQWNKSRVYQFPLSPSQVQEYGLEFRGIYGIEESYSNDPDIRRFILTPQPIDYLEGKENKKVFQEPTFSVPTWTKGKPNDGELNEDRDPNLEYEVDEVAGEIDRITVEIKKQKGSSWTKLGNQIKALRLKIKELSTKEKELSDSVKKKFPEIFDSSDEVLTRVVRTHSMIAMMTKPGQSEQTKTDYEKVVLAILELNLLPEQQQAVTAIVKKYTETNTIKTPSKLRINVSESVMGRLKEIWSSFYSKILVWGQQQDNKLDKISKMFDSPIQESILNEEMVFSSWIEDLSYEQDDSNSGEGDVILTLRNGRSYTVYNVDYGLYEDWLNSASKGQFFHRYIKNGYMIS